MEESIPSKTDGSSKPSFDYTKIIYDFLLVGLLVIGFILRTTGLNWDEGNHLHPDERFLTGVETALIPVESLSDYWNTEISTLNPNNQGAGYFVYGTLPIFLVRYAAESIQKTGYGEITLLGRQLSTLADLGAVFLVYLIAARLYNKRTAFLAAAFSTFTVLQIQISHYFVVDNFLNMFTLLPIYFAVLISTSGDPKEDGFKFRFPHFIWFGIGLGLAVSSKVTTAPVAILLPLAVILRLAKMPPTARRDDLSVRAFIYMIAAAVVSLLVFRIFQPYAFAGPGFFNVKINQAWMGNLRSIASQSAGNIDWPPSIQWARIPLWFSGQNMILWGIGLPMGIASWLGFLWASYQVFKGKWEKHGVIWFWTAAYFAWQSSAFNPTMRYQLPIYPTLAVFAGWGVSALWDKVADITSRFKNVLRAAAWIVGGLSLGLTALYAFAFITIYQRPVTRVQASSWIYKNVPGPINLHIDTGDEVYNQPMPFPYGFVIDPGSVYLTSFTPNVNGELTEISLKHYSVSATRRLAMTIEDTESSNVPLSFAAAEIDFNSDEQIVTRDTAFVSGAPITLHPQREYLIRIALEPGQSEIMLHGAVLQLLSQAGIQTLNLVDEAVIITSTTPFETSFTVDETFTQGEVIALFANNRTLTPEDQPLQLIITDGGAVVAQAETLLKIENSKGEGATFVFNEPLELVKDKVYQMTLGLLTDSGDLTLLGSVITIETGWDDPLPLRVDGYDGYGGIYQRNQNFNMEWDSNAIKLEHMLDLLNKADYISISSSRQWASIPRIPERFPLLVTYYRELLGCPIEYTIEHCYNIAEPGMFEGNLGFELVQTFQSDPTLGSFSINDQPSEEAFTVYDHPKAFVFQKTEDYDHQKVTEILSAVDLSNVIRLTPKDASDYDPETEEETPSLLLPADRLETQRAGGTWSDLFDYESFVNRY